MYLNDSGFIGYSSQMGIGYSSQIGIGYSSQAVIRILARSARL
jgi:hypothetical protein